MHKGLKNRILTSTVILALALVIGVLGSSVIAGDDRSELAYTPDNLIRLHVIANSNSAFDQELKLKVRDQILQVATRLFAGVESRQEALAILQQHEEEFLKPAREVIAASGKNYPIRLEVGTFDFPAKSYGSMTLPAGKYCAARFVIGAGAGENWWCVLFPPLCLFEEVRGVERIPVAADATVSNNLSDINIADGRDLTTGEIEFRFKYMPGIGAKYRYAERIKELLQPTLAWLRLAPSSVGLLP